MKELSYNSLKDDVCASGEIAYDYVKMVVKQGMSDGGADIDTLFVLLTHEWKLFGEKRLSAYMHSWLRHRAKYASFEKALTTWDPTLRDETSHRSTPRHRQRICTGGRIVYV